jgi:hypothetical protein
MSLDIPIRDLLRSPQVSEINFHWRGIIVTGQGFRELSNCFFENNDPNIRHRIRVTVRPQLVAHDAEAQYDPDNDKINLRSLNSLDTAPQRGSVVHECTHAQIDLRSIATNVQNEEGAAFIAETWYMLASNVDSATIDNRVTQEIREITADLRSQTLLGGPAQLSQAQIDVVRRVMFQFGYRSGHYTSNGIRGYRYRGD